MTLYQWRRFTFKKKLRIESLRIQNGLTIRGLAELSGVSKTAIGDIATGVKTSINKKQVQGFCKAFNCNPEDLFE
ncbi:helix-turn-helix domain-containing protein [Pelosinus sp. UFO1]|uniref:helix-turn-helix domain-containing protein n=1 Tax=Pelosinus sp. UFO1 TaxID=484770 RepID=UPI0008FF882B|nr:helix-turn-helix transcriptional regulator [Pelosinus sp. UFO1]